MTKDLTFSEVCKYIRKESLETFDKLDIILGLTIVFSSVLAGPIALPLLNLLDTKSELISLGKKLIAAINNKNCKNYIEHKRKMEVVFITICYTAFFDALDDSIPKELRAHIALKKVEKASYIIDVIPQEYINDINGPFNIPITFPHPLTTLNGIKSQLIDIYKQMTDGFKKFVEKLNVYENPELELKKKLIELEHSLPNLAIEYFEAQYFELAIRYEEFRVWINTNEHRILEKGIDENLKGYFSILKGIEGKIDTGFAQMHKIIEGMPIYQFEIETQRIIDRLNQKYLSMINEPIIEEEINNSNIVYPKIVDIFIPQNFKSLKYYARDIMLEKEETWGQLQKRSDLSRFLLDFINSPYSINSLLLILGHPGCGKSILSKMIAANFMSNSYTTIRVPLRDVKVDNEIETIIEDQIRKDTGGDHISNWAEFIDQFKEKPLLVIFDGYDELLQANSSVYAGYIDKIHRFQEEQLIHAHPIRIVITSRLTLINKTTVPINTTVLRLLEFDEKQRINWINIWNITNEEYFCKNNLKKFCIPKESRFKIIELSEQPLLLTMLAIYDSDNNSLEKNIQINRSGLYNSILYRFVKREARRYNENFDILTEEEQEELADKEILNFGLIAIGMFNRRTLCIYSSELLNDYNFFHKIKEDKLNPINVDLLLGRFFFIHKSKSIEGNELNYRVNMSFEFLHNTFGEFLAAKFIINSLVSNIKLISSMNNKELMSKMHEMINNPNELSTGWYMALAYSPLYLRPVIPDMIREWIFYELDDKKIDKEVFLAIFNKISIEHIKAILFSKFLPDIFIKSDTTCYNELPYLGLITNYTINIITINTILAGTEYIFNEKDYCEVNNISENTSPWDRLTSIWRSWYNYENLWEISSIFSSIRENDKVIIKCNQEFITKPSGDNLDVLYHLSSSISDNISGGFSKLHLKTEYIEDRFSAAQRDLRTEKIDISFEVLIIELRNSIYCSYEKFDPVLIRRNIHEGIDMLKEIQSEDSTNAFIDILELIINKNIFTMQEENIILSKIIDMFASYYGPISCIMRYLNLVIHFANRNGVISIKDNNTHIISDEQIRILGNEAGLIFEWCDISYKQDSELWFVLFGKKIINHILKYESISRIVKIRPDIMINLLKLSIKYRGSDWITYVSDEQIRNVLIEFSLNDFFELCPDLAIEWLELARDFLNEDDISLKLQDYYDYIKKPIYYTQLIRFKPEVIIEWLSIDNSFLNNKIIKSICRLLHAQFIDSSYIKDNIILNPEISLKILDFEKDNAKFVQGSINIVLLDIMSDDDLFKKILYRNPGVLIEWIKVASKIEKNILREKLYNIYILLNNYYLDKFFRMSKKHALTIIKLLWLFRDENIIEKYRKSEVIWEYNKQDELYDSIIALDWFSGIINRKLIADL